METQAILNNPAQKIRMKSHNKDVPRIFFFDKER